MTFCWLARHGVYERGPMSPCDGKLIRAHLIPRQLLLRELDAVRAVEAIEDPRSWVPACGGPMGNGGHHHMLDYARTLRIPLENLPDGLWELAEETGLLWWIERTYNERRAA